MQPSKVRELNREPHTENMRATMAFHDGTHLNGINHKKHAINDHPSNSRPSLYFWECPSQLILKNTLKNIWFWLDGKDKGLGEWQIQRTNALAGVGLAVIAYYSGYWKYYFWLQIFASLFESKLEIEFI